MKKLKYKYTVYKGGSEIGTIETELDSCDDIDSLADEYYHKYDGWKDTWPLEFHVWREEHYVGKFLVDMEKEPHFYSTEIREQS